MHSYCLAGGTDLMLACDLAVASDDAVFGYVDIRFGSGVVSMFLPWVVGVRAAKELILTGQDRVPAAEALRIGLVNRVVPRDELDDATMALADEIAKNEPFVVRTMKASINRVVAERRAPGRARRQHGAGRDDRDGQPSRPRRVPAHHPGGGSEGRDRLARRAVPGHRVIYGLAAALGWGLSDLWAAISGRRIGSGRTVVVAQVAAAVVVTLLVLVVRPDLSGIPTVAPWLIPNAFLGAAAFSTLYKGLELGPIAVVSPVLASYAVVPVLLSVVLLGETLAGWEVVGVAVTIAGAVLTSTDPKALRAGTRTKPAGLPWAIVSTLLFGVATYIMGWAAKEAGFLPSLWFGRLTMMTCVPARGARGVAAVAFRRRGARAGGTGDAQARGDGRGGGAGRDDRLRTRRRGRPGVGRDRRLRDLPADPGPRRRECCFTSARSRPSTWGSRW